MASKYVEIQNHSGPKFRASKESCWWILVVKKSDIFAVTKKVSVCLQDSDLISTGFYQLKPTYLLKHAQLVHWGDPVAYH